MSRRDARDLRRRLDHAIDHAMGKPSKPDGATIAAGVTLGLGIFTGLAFLRGWALMLVLGAVHSYASDVPPIAFWPCVGLALAVGLVLSGLRGGKSNG